MRWLKLNQQRYDLIYNTLINAPGGFDRKSIRTVHNLLTTLEGFGDKQEDSTYQLKKDMVWKVGEDEYKIIDTCISNLKFYGRYATNAVEFLNWWEGPHNSEPTEPDNG